MKTKKCKYCMMEIDKKAKVCPNCKRKLKGNGCLFAILIPIIMAAVIAIVVINSTIKKGSQIQTSNSDSSASVLDSPKSNKSKSNDKDKIYKIGDTITIHDFEITINSLDVEEQISDDSGYLFYSPEDGSKYIVINADVKNIANGIQEFLPSVHLKNDVNTKIRYQDYDFAATNFMGVPHSDLHDTSLNPLSSTSGIIVFEVANEFVEKIDELELVFYTLDEDYIFSLNQ